jgi:hypothetical protein
MASNASTLIAILDHVRSLGDSYSLDEIDDRRVKVAAPKQ